MMRKYLKFRSLAATILSLSLVFAATSCEEKEPVEERPALPPIESLKMDFSDFAEEPGGAKGILATYQNFWYSFWTVAIWNSAAVIVTALPVTAYAYALQQTPVYVGDHTWEWAFDFTWDTKDYTATLTGARINNEEFSMEMVIALAATPKLGVKWFDGVVRYNHTHAEWTLYRNGITNVLEIGWNNDFETGEADLTYTLTDPDHAQNGSYIMLAHRPDLFLDAAYTISLNEGMTYIEWNSGTLEGRVKAPVHFEDEDWHCWDSQANGLADRECAQ